MIKRGNVGNTKYNVEGVLREGFIDGTYITIKYSEGVHHFQKLFGIVKVGASRTLSKNVKSENVLIAIVVKPKEC